MKKITHALLGFFVVYSGSIHATEGMAGSVRGVVSLVGLAATGAVVKFVSHSDGAQKALGAVGVLPKEAALVVGSMGGFFSLSSSVPAVAPYGWLIPVAWGSLRIASTRWFRALVNGIPNVGDNLMDDETVADFDKLSVGDAIDGESAGIKKSRARAAIFSTLFVATGLYVPIKYLLEAQCDYPRCMIDSAGRNFDRLVQALVGR